MFGEFAQVSKIVFTFCITFYSVMESFAAQQIIFCSTL